MIRLSELTMLEFGETTFSLNINDRTNRLYLYNETENFINRSLILFDDTYTKRQNTKNNAVANFWDNVLLGTTNDYPSDGLGKQNYLESVSFQSLLNDNDITPLLFRKIRLYFANGTLLDPEVIGHHLRIYVKLSNGNTVDILSSIDLNRDTNITVKGSRFFENKVFSECIEFDIIDIDYLINSNVPDVQNVKNLLFGSDKPTTYLIEYSSFKSDSLDEFSENGLAFTKFNPSVINEVSHTISMNADDLYVELKYMDNDFSISSQMKHENFDVGEWLSGIEYDVDYQVTHHVEMNWYDGRGALIESDDFVISKTNKFDNVKFRPIAPLTTNYGEIKSTIKITNPQTGLSFSKSNSLVVTSDNVDKFYPKSNMSFNLVEEKIYNVTEKNITRLNHTNQVPDIVHVEKIVFRNITPDINNSITIYNASGYYVVNIPQLTDEQNNQMSNSSDKNYLQIASELIESDKNNNLTFFIPQRIYNKNPQSFLLLDKNRELITNGVVNRL